MKAKTLAKQNVVLIFVSIFVNPTKSSYFYSSFLDNYSDTLTLSSGFRLHMSQFMALLEKKFLNSLRNWILLTIKIAIPVIFVALTIVTARSWSGNQDLPELQLSLGTYSPTVTTIEFNPIVSSDSINTKIFESYRNQLQADGLSVDEISGDMTDHYLSISRESQALVNNRYLYGVTIENPSITVWYSNQPYHASPISLNVLHNAVLQAVSGRQCTITIANKPLAYRAETRIMMLQAATNLGLHLSVNIGVAMSFVASLFSLVYIKERVTKAKLLQFVSGINALIYWLTAFLWDYCLFIIIALLATATIGAFQEDGYSTFEELGRIFFVFLIFGFAMLPFIYNSAFLFSIPASGFSNMSIFFVFSSVSMFALIFSLGLESFDMKHVADILSWIFLTIPHFALIDALSNINVNNVIVDVCQRQCDQTGACGDFLCKINPICCSKFFYIGNNSSLVIYYFSS